MVVVDAHAHIVPAVFPELPDGMDPRGWPSMEPLEDGRARMMIDGKQFRIIDRGYFDFDARIEWMDRHNIAFQVLSPLPELFGYWLDAGTAHALARLTNRTIAQTVQRNPRRLAGLGMLPLQDIPRSVEMVEELAALGLRGIEAGSNVGGVSIADPAFDPVYAALTRHDMAVFVHGSRPAGNERLLGPPILVNVIGIPGDCTAAIASFITTDILARHPTLRLGFAHGGGTFGAVLERMDFVWGIFPALKATTSVSPRDYVKRFYFDTITYSVPYLRYLIESYGADTLMCGTDGPVAGAQTNLEAMVEDSCHGDGAAAEKLMWRNTLRFLGLSEAPWA